MLQVIIKHISTKKITMPYWKARIWLNSSVTPNKKNTSAQQMAKATLKLASLITYSSTRFIRLFSSTPFRMGYQPNSPMKRIRESRLRISSRLSKEHTT